jgi:hypothetical protein
MERCHALILSAQRQRAGRIRASSEALPTEIPVQPQLSHLVMPLHHDVRSSDVFTRRLHGTLAAAVAPRALPRGAIDRGAEKRAALELWADALDAVLGRCPPEIEGYPARLARSRCSH